MDVALPEPLAPAGPGLHNASLLTSPFTFQARGRESERESCEVQLRTMLAYLALRLWEQAPSKAGASFAEPGKRWPTREHASYRPLSPRKERLRRRLASAACR